MKKVSRESLNIILKCLQPEYRGPTPLRSMKINSGNEIDNSQTGIPWSGTILLREFEDCLSKMNPDQGIPA